MLVLPDSVKATSEKKPVDLLSPCEWVAETGSTRRIGIAALIYFKRFSSLSHRLRSTMLIALFLTTIDFFGWWRHSWATSWALLWWMREPFFAKNTSTSWIIVAFFLFRKCHRKFKTKNKKLLALKNFSRIKNRRRGEITQIYFSLKKHLFLYGYSRAQSNMKICLFSDDFSGRRRVLIEHGPKKSFSCKRPFRETWMTCFLLANIHLKPRREKLTFFLSYFHFNISSSRCVLWKVTNLKIVLVKKMKRERISISFLTFFECFGFA